MSFQGRSTAWAAAEAGDGMATSFARKDMTPDNWREWPFSRWSFQHVSEFVPVAPITFATAAEPTPSDQGLLSKLDVEHTDQGAMRATSWLAQSNADCCVIMRNGQVLDEWHAPHVDPANPHIIFSISKSLTGMLAGLAVADGALDVDAPISRYVEVGAESAYADATVRHLLDMSVALDFVEDYEDKTGPFDRYRRSTLWNPQRPGTARETLEQVLASLPRAAGPHGKVFYYASPNTDLAGLVIERATGVRFHEYLAERIWKPMGARGASFVTVDAVGTARAAGGICVTTRDLARFGQLVLDGGRTAAGEQLIPAEWVADMRGNGDPQAWKDGNFSSSFADGRYRSFWYDTGDGRGSFCGIGIHAQWLWVDPTSRVVIALTSSRPVASDDAAQKVETHMLGQIARAI